MELAQGLLSSLEKNGFARGFTLLWERSNLGASGAFLELFEDRPIFFRGSSYFFERLFLIRISMSVCQDRRDKPPLEKLKRIRLRHNIML